MEKQDVYLARSQTLRAVWTGRGGRGRIAGRGGGPVAAERETEGEGGREGRKGRCVREREREGGRINDIT